MAFSLFTVLKGILVQNATDRTKQVSLEASDSSTANTRTTISVSQTADRTVTIPDGGDTSFVTPDSVDTLTNKSMDGDDNTFSDIAIESLKAVPADAGKVLARALVTGEVISMDVPGITPVYQDNTFTIQNAADNTKQAKFDASAISPSTTRTFAFPNSSDTLVGTTVVQTLQSKTLDNTNTLHPSDAHFWIQNDSDSTKRLVISASNVPTSTTVTLQVPTANTTLVGTNTTDTLTNKTLTSPTITTPAVNGGETYDQISTPANPAASHNKLYFKSDNLLYSLDSSGNEAKVTTPAPTKQVFTTTGAGTYTTPSKCKFIKVTCVGGGGGSGGVAISTSNAAAAGGGGGGGTGITWITNPSSSYAIVVGTGGAGGATGNNPGGQGADTTFGSTICEGFGGLAGDGSAAGGTVLNDGGAGGAAVGDVIMQGAGGTAGFSLSTAAAIGGNGGSSSYGGARAGLKNSTPGTLTNGYGAGAAGRAITNNASAQGGIPGRQGIIIVEEYY